MALAVSAKEEGPAQECPVVTRQEECNKNKNDKV